MAFLAVFFLVFFAGTRDPLVRAVNRANSRISHATAVKVADFGPNLMFLAGFWLG